MVAKLQNIHAVIDTNVLLDITSCYDLFVAYNTYLLLGEGMVEATFLRYRRARARESMLLAMHLNRIGAHTYSLHSEPIAQLMRTAPPAKGGTSFEADFTTMFLHFVKDYVLPDWQPQLPTVAGTAKGTAADNELVAFAKEHALPLITNEGFSPTGVKDEKMRKKAIAAGVAVFTPRQFYSQAGVDEAEEVASFLERFNDHAPRFIKERKKMFGKHDKGGDVLLKIFGYFRHVLLGITEGRDAPVRVSMDLTR